MEGVDPPGGAAVPARAAAMISSHSFITTNSSGVGASPSSKPLERRRVSGPIAPVVQQHGLGTLVGSSPQA